MRNKVGLGLGPAFQLRLGAELWDQWILGFAAGVYAPSDKRPTSEIVVTCTRVEGQEVGCDPPARQESGVTGGMLSFESGYQRRFRPWLSSSFAPGALLGYTVMPKPPKRGVGCEGCARRAAARRARRGPVRCAIFSRHHRQRRQLRPRRTLADLPER